MGPTRRLSKNDFQSYFSVLSGKQGGTLYFRWIDTLVSGPGKKWVALKPIWRSNYTGKKWAYLNDDIEIALYNGELVLDQTSSDVFVKNVGNTFQICLKDSSKVSFRFNVFGDTTFSDTLQVWIATRGLSADFFSELPQRDLFFKDGKNKPVYDCFLETPPQTFLLNNFNVIASLNIDFNDHYQVSTLKEIDNKLSLMASYDKTDFVKIVSPGSLLGYVLADTNRFLNSYHDSISSQWQLSSYSYFAGFDKTPAQLKTQGFHVVATDARLTSYPAFTQGKFDSIAPFPERLVSYDGIPYLNPFRNLPLHSSDVKKGYKEFVIIAYTKGRYFGEPRVFLSTHSSTAQYVWDKVPPQIIWADDYDPSITSWYAPMYYQDSKNIANNRISNLSLVGNIFEVCFSTRPVGEVGTAVRDVGFGMIDSLKLCFAYATDTYTTNPITGLRHYASPVKIYPLDRSTIAGQKFALYGANGSNTKDKISYALQDISFSGIDARYWKTGKWDMWIETKDNLGNKGIAPFGDLLDMTKGNFFIRQIEIK